MRYVKPLALAVVLLAVGWWLWTVLFPSPDAVIRRQLTKLAETASFPAKEGNFGRLARVEKLGNLFAEHVEFAVDLPGVERNMKFDSRAELKQAAAAYASFTRGVQAKFVGVQVEVLPGAETADVDLTLNAKIEGERDEIVQELKFNLKKIDGDWLITRVQTVKALR
jgi:hypothetical protein